MMTLFWPGLHVIYIAFLFKTRQVCTDTFESKEMGTHEQTSGKNFTLIPQGGFISIWNVSEDLEESTTVKYSGKNVQFCSGKAYLIVAHKRKGRFVVYYWLGKNTSLIDKKLAAKEAVALSLFPKYRLMGGFRRMFIARETEGMESDSFHHTMMVFNRQAACLNRTYPFPIYLEQHFPAPRPNLYVVYGDSHSRIKKTPLSAGIQWIKKNDICLVLEVECKVDDLQPIYYFCGTAAYGKHYRRSSQFAYYFAGFLYYEWERHTYSIENNKQSSDFKRFLEVLEDCRYYNPNEVDDSDDHLKNATEFVSSRDQVISLFDITTDGLIENRRRPIRSNIFKEDSMGYLLDTKSVAGVFLIFGGSKKMFNRSEAIQLAEEYMDDQYTLSSEQIVKMRIVETNVNSHIIDFEIHLSDYPPLRRDVPDYFLW